VSTYKPIEIKHSVKIRGKLHIWMVDRELDSDGLL
jgi:hypothetical protein